VSDRCADPSHAPASETDTRHGGPKTFRRWDEAARAVPSVTGFIYTTWKANYKDLEACSHAMQGKK